MSASYPVAHSSLRMPPMEVSKATAMLPSCAAHPGRGTGAALATPESDQGWGLPSERAERSCSRYRATAYLLFPPVRWRASKGPGGRATLSSSQQPVPDPGNSPSRYRACWFGELPPGAVLSAQGPDGCVQVVCHDWISSLQAWGCRFFSKREQRDTSERSAKENGGTPPRELRDTSTASRLREREGATTGSTTTKIPI